MPKHNKLGIHNIVGEKCLQILSGTIDVALRPKPEKTALLSEIRRNTEILKHLIRLEYELGIIKDITYINLAGMLENISMMATGWQKSLQTQKPLM